MATEAKLEANRRYLNKTEEVRGRVKKGSLEKIRTHAEQNGHKSLNAYIVGLIRKDMGGIEL
jgi:hypothetical protein